MDLTKRSYQPRDLMPTKRRSLKRRERLKRLSELDFGCSICKESDGTISCKQLRLLSKSNPLFSSASIKPNTLCCSDCARSYGYLDSNVYSKKELEDLKSMFDPTLGFWKEGVGCTIPRELRSTVCSAFNCSNLYRAIYNYIDKRINFDQLKTIVEGVNK